MSACRIALLRPQALLRASIVAVLVVGTGEARADVYEECLGKHGDADRQISACKEIIDKRRDTRRFSLTQAYFRLGGAYLLTKRPALAINAYSEAIRLAPAGPNAFAGYNNRGLAYEATGQFELAIADYSKAIELRDNYVSGYINRGSVYARSGQIERALSDLWKALALEPKGNRAERIRKKIASLQASASKPPRQASAAAQAADSSYDYTYVGTDSDCAYICAKQTGCQSHRYDLATRKCELIRDPSQRARGTPTGQPAPKGPSQRAEGNESARVAKSPPYSAPPSSDAPPAGNPRSGKAGTEFDDLNALKRKRQALTAAFKRAAREESGKLDRYSGVYSLVQDCSPELFVYDESARQFSHSRFLNQFKLQATQLIWFEGMTMHSLALDTPQQTKSSRLIFKTKFSGTPIYRALHETGDEELLSFELDRMKIITALTKQRIFFQWRRRCQNGRHMKDWALKAYDIMIEGIMIEKNIGQKLELD
ncbi:MAG: tetratricopeptide repeat protein [Xanthobacteraceae bacterium]